MHGRKFTAIFSLALILAVFGAWLISIDRYPLFYVDDAFFNYPALRAAHGEPLTYRVSSSAPFADDVWAYHGPLYPNLQAMLFRVFGDSQAVSRLPDFLGGWLAAALVVSLLIRRGYKLAPAVLAVLWVGDRATQEILYGRMDGVVLLCLAGAFVFIERCWRGGSRLDCFLAGLALSLACAFHPLAIAFLVSGSIAIAIRRGLVGLISEVIGTIPSIVLVLWCWHFQVRKALTQFLWHATLDRAPNIRTAFLTMIEVLRWSKYWALALLIFTLIVLLPLAVRLLLSDRKLRKLDLKETLLFLSLIFSLAGVFCLFRTSVHPYYLVHFTLWPMLAISIIVEAKPRWMLLPGALLFICWLPSGAWNALRLREAVIYRSQLSPRYIEEVIRANVPIGAIIYTTPEPYVLPFQAGYAGEVAPWFAEHAEVPDSAYVLLDQKEFDQPNYFAAEAIHTRPILYRGATFPGARMMEYPILLLGPRRQKSTSLLEDRAEQQLPPQRQTQ